MNRSCFPKNIFFSNDSLRIFIYNVLNTMQLHIQQVNGQAQAQRAFTATVDSQNAPRIFIGTILVLVMKSKLSGYKLDIEEEGLR